MDEATLRRLTHDLQYIGRRVALSDVNEDFLLDVMATARSKYKVKGAVLLLRHFGTVKSLNALKECCVRPIVDLQVTALFTIAMIAGASQADYYEELFSKKEYRQKWVAMSLLCQFGGPKHLKTILERAKKVVKRKRACPEYGTLLGRETEVTAALEYLKRNRLYDRPIAKVLASIEMNGTHLTDNERIAIRQFRSERPIA